MQRKGYVYILTNFTNRVLYIGVTSDLPKRVYEHKNKTFSGFTAKYKADKLVYFEEHPDMASAIDREKHLKRGTRMRKIELVSALNPCWIELPT